MNLDINGILNNEGNVMSRKKKLINTYNENTGNKRTIESESEFELYDKIFRDNNKLNTPLENPFIQHFLFDPYIKEERGNNPILVAKNFIELIKLFLIKNKNNINALEKDKFIHIQNLLKTSIEIRNLMNSDVSQEIFFSKMNNYLKTNKELLLLAGWTDSSGGHAITIELKENENKNHDIYIFNSGDGIEYHALNEKKRGIGIKIDNVNKDDLFDILDLIRFSVYNYLDKLNYLDTFIVLKDKYNIEFKDQAITLNKRLLTILEKIKELTEGEIPYLFFENKKKNIVLN